MIDKERIEKLREALAHIERVSMAMGISSVCLSARNALAADDALAAVTVPTHADLCTLLQLDPERATPDDVLALVGGLLDAAGRLDRLRAALAGVADAGPCALAQAAAALRALREDGERGAPVSPWRPVSEEPEWKTRCLVSGKYHFDAVCYYDNGAWFLLHGSPLDRRPTHWMPIPPPPEQT